MHSPITIFAGIDWATDGHAICVIDGSGTILERYEIEHSEAGLRDLVHRLRVDRVSGIAIERPDGPVVDALLAAGLEVVVIASRHVKGLRTRYGLAGNNASPRRSAQPGWARGVSSPGSLERATRVIAAGPSCMPGSSRHRRVSAAKGLARSPR